MRCCEAANSRWSWPNPESDPPIRRCQHELRRGGWLEALSERAGLGSATGPAVASSCRGTLLVVPPQATDMPRSHRRIAGFSLVELLIVIAVMGILAGIVLPSSNPTIHDQLRSAAQIVATDLAYARSLAVTHGSLYRTTFDTAANRYVIEHSGTNPALDRLPSSPFRDPDDPPDQHVVDLGNLPRIGAYVQLVAVTTVGGMAARPGEVEFGPLGETSESKITAIWLSAGNDRSRRYIVLHVNPITGLATIGPFSGVGP